MKFEIQSNERIAPGVYRMTLAGDTSGITAPGQFVNVELDGFYLRRPISVCDWDARALTIIYKVVGRGTAAMSALTPGAELDLLTGLGNGYDTSVETRSPLLVGGGVGIPPLFALAKALLNRGEAKPRAILGFNTASEAFLIDEFNALGIDAVVCTADGSLGERGFVTAPLPRIPHDYFFACGPEPMLRALCEATGAPGQLSFEERMGCGFGACMGCSCQTLTGHKRICKDGPVLRKEEIAWPTRG